LLLRPLGFFACRIDGPFRHDIDVLETLSALVDEDRADRDCYDAHDQGRQPGIESEADQDQDDGAQQDERPGIGDGATRTDHRGVPTGVRDLRRRLSAGEVDLLTNERRQLPTQVAEQLTEASVIALFGHLGHPFDPPVERVARVEPDDVEPDGEVEVEPEPVSTVPPAGIARVLATMDDPVSPMSLDPPPPLPRLVPDPAYP
jgi:hypothetical protein